MVEIKRIDIYKDNNYEIYMQNIVKFPMLSYVIIETKELIYSLDIGVIGMISNINEFDSSDIFFGISKDDIVKVIKEKFEFYKNEFKEAVEKDNPFSVFSLLDKRLLTSQLYKCVENKSFSDYQIYQLATDSYSRCEDDYGYDLITEIIREYKEKDKRIENEIKEKLRDKIKDGYVYVYRGFNKFSREEGVSFTFKKEVAELFSTRWNSKGLVRKYKIPVEHIIAYIDEGEDEIISDIAIEL